MGQGRRRGGENERLRTSVAPELKNFIGGICGSDEQFSLAWRHNRATEVGENGEGKQGKKRESRGGGFWLERSGGKGDVVAVLCRSNRWGWRLKVEDDSDGWDPPVRKKRKKRKGKKKKGRGAAGCCWAGCPGLAQLGCYPLFLFFSFSFFCFKLWLFENISVLVLVNFKFCRTFEFMSKYFGKPKCTVW
jgi:hypothetical protein